MPCARSTKKDACILHGSSLFNRICSPIVLSIRIFNRLYPQGAPFFCLDAKEPKNQGFVCFATRSLHSAARIANSRFALKQRCSRSLRSGRSLNAYQPRPILSPLPSSLAVITPHPFGELPYNRGAFLSPEDSSPVLRGAGSRSETEGLRCLPCHNISCVHLRRKILRLYKQLA